MLPIDHLNRHVSNVGDFVAFYCDILGYEMLRRGLKANGKPYAILRGAGHELFISEKDGFGKDEAGTFRHIGYAVESADAMLRKCKESGVAEPEREIIAKPFSRQFYIRDPDGFEIDIIEWTDKKGFYEEKPSN
jgi:catechol 2,3-dioxygenase-like lactoylglutathione lyase family enzyme